MCAKGAPTVRGTRFFGRNRGRDSGRRGRRRGAGLGFSPGNDEGEGDGEQPDDGYHGDGGREAVAIVENAAEDHAHGAAEANKPQEQAGEPPAHCRLACPGGDVAALAQARPGHAPCEAGEEEDEEAGWETVGKGGEETDQYGDDEGQSGAVAFEGVAGPAVGEEADKAIGAEQDADEGERDAGGDGVQGEDAVHERVAHDAERDGGPDGGHHACRAQGGAGAGACVHVCFANFACCAVWSGNGD